MSTTLDQTSSLSLAAKSRARDFYELTKPRMNFLVVITTAVGFYLAAGSSARPATGWLLLNTIFGTALTAAGASVLNQWWEREHDKLMPRTRNRPLPGGRIDPAEALLFGIAMGVAGIAHLFFLVNPLTSFLGAATLLSYVLIYTPMKRISTLNTVIGAVPGAIPPMMGFTAVHNALSPEALSIFGILFMWQLPHFLAIAMMYRNDYSLGGFKMLPCTEAGFEMARRQIVLWGIAMIPVSLLPVGLGMTGPIYFTAAVLLGLAYLSFGVSCAATGSRIDAKKLFFASIAYLPLLLGFLMMDKR
jgi:heme o synthase